MAQLPTFQDLGQSPVPQPTTSPTISADVINQPYVAMDKAGKVLVDVGEEERKSRYYEGLLQQGFAKSSFLAKQAEIEQQISQDPDFQNYDKKYKELIQPAIQETSAMVSDPWHKARLAATLQNAVRLGETRVGAMQNKMAVDDGRARLQDLMTQNADTFQRLGDEKDRAALTQSMNDAIEGAAQSGFITQQEKVQWGKKFVHDTAVGTYTTMALTNPQAAIDILSPKPNGSSPLTLEQQKAIHVAASAHGVDPNLLARTATLESGGDQNAQNPNSSAGGLFQLTDATATGLGVTDKTDLSQSADAAAALAAQNKAALSKSLGRTPTSPELYLAHQQGAGGAAALLMNPKQNAIEALTPVYGDADKATKAIVNNGGSPDMTAAQFVDKWDKKYAGDSGTHDLFPKTGTSLDYVPPEKRMELQNVALAQLERGMRLKNQMAKEEEDKTNQQFLLAKSQDKLTPEMILGSNLPAIGQGSKDWWLNEINKPDKVNPDSPDVIKQRGILENMKIDNPDQFTNYDFVGLSGKLPSAEIAKFQGEAAAMRKGDKGIEESNKNAKDIVTAVEGMLPYNWQHPTVGSHDEVNANAFKGLLIQGVRQAQAVSGKPLIDTDIQKIASSLLGKVKIGASDHWYSMGSTVEAYKIPAGTDPLNVFDPNKTNADKAANIYIPESFRMGFTRAWQNKYNVPPQDKDIALAYTKSVKASQ